MPAYTGREGDTALDGAEETCSPVYRFFGGGGSSGSSFKMLIIFDRFAGTCLGGPSEGSGSVELGRENSFGGDSTGAG